MAENSRSSLTRLTDTALGGLNEAIKRPSYVRAALKPGIVHIGVGNFHRAHQAWYLHKLMEQGLAHDWAILGAGVRASDAAMRARLLAQDCLTTLIELDPNGSSAEVVGSMINYLPVEESNAVLIAAMSDPAIRIVSLTITEGGYFQTSTGAFNADHPDVAHDVAHPNEPRTAFGAIVASLKARRMSGAGPFTVLSCDNLQGNGDILRQTVVGLARLMDADLANWIDQSATFPNSMVDCIVPATGETELALARSFGVEDQAPVTHENFRQWVIEDAFCAGRPPLEQAGVTLTDDVHAYESMKIRILNGGHQLLANAGEILALPTIASCMDHSGVSAFFRKVQLEEILPHVKPVPGMEPDHYLSLIEQRFSNPKIHDTTRRVAFDGSSRHAGFLIPTIREAVEVGASVEGLALAQALWARMCAGSREDGSTIEPNDPHWDVLTQTALSARDEPIAWLKQSYYGGLSETSRFTEAFDRWLRALWQEGCDATLKAYVLGG
ncbi:mannitol 2-dehydrogenase [Roseibium sp. TrichSKD4]|uniref:mannitol dehydrogenase family protein n=1 Tax=Roseibium sp. TrichSKD4 TaxID=744980 RepID=UPI0001E56DCF|nr:mannitol dehydrogenase family protein [Roseibium sp. TrichSKD4]EFO33290.1 mannitol 2-dehydrogenase [Roseibium sp. TrichSKD4]